MKKTMKSLRRERAGLWAGFWGFVFCIVALGRLVAADTRGNFLKLIDRPRVAADAVVTTRPSADGLTEYHFTFASDAQQRVPGFLIEKSDGPAVRRPVVIALHGTGGTKSDELPLLRILANRGFIAVAIDGRYHGERMKSGNGAGRGSAEYQDAILRTFRGGGEHPFYFDTVWDVMRLIDYLQTRDDVDPTRIGLYGVSKGGIETYLSAAVDPRISVAVPCIGLESFKWALDNNDWQGRIGTIPIAFAAAAKDRGITTPTSDFVHEFYNHRRRIRWPANGEIDRSASADGHQQRHRSPYAAARRATLRRCRPRRIHRCRRVRPFRHPHSAQDRPQGQSRFTGGGGRLVRAMAQAVGANSTPISD
ncbi:MAG: acetylxylan esterase [Tepidisphaeraceae bacterium]